MATKDDQQGGDKPEAVPPAGAEGSTARTDDAWKQNFPQAAQANAGRDAYQKTADQVRIEAERAANMALAAKKEEERKAEVNADPFPTGEGENPHAEEPATDPLGDAEPKPENEEYAPPTREPPQQ